MNISIDALRENKGLWEKLGPISSGGTVFGLAISPVLRVLGFLVSPTPHIPLYWAATSCGIFRTYTSGKWWKQYLTGLTTPFLSSLAVASNGYLFAGAFDGSLFYSNDFGLTWQVGEVPPELKASVTSLMASPDFPKDRTAFAATADGHILVTRDSGESWEDSGFEVADSSVLALAVGPNWTDEKRIFAATTEGVYVSLDEGQAWQKTDLSTNGDVVDALAVSPAFENDHSVYAGTEGGRLFHSVDSGDTWELLQAEVGEGPLNCLWLAPEFAESGRMVCGVGTDIYVSSDRGKSWQMAARTPNSVLVLAGDKRSVIAGLYDAGMWESRDGGISWESASGDLSARGFAWLRASGNKLYSMGPQEGVWVSANGGEAWENLPGLEPYLPLTAFNVADENILLVASQSGGILRSTDHGQSWSPVSQAQGVQALVLEPETGYGWAGTSEGKLLVSQDGGATWHYRESPCEGQEILSLVASPKYVGDHTLLMGSALPGDVAQQDRIAVWRSTDDGATWQQVANLFSSARWVDIVMPPAVENPAEQIILATGPYSFRSSQRAKDVWISTSVDSSTSANTMSVVGIGEVDEGVLYAATGAGVFRSVNGGRTWRPYVEGLDAGSFISLALVSDEEQCSLYALSLGGVIWKRELLISDI